MTLYGRALGHSTGEVSFDADHQEIWGDFSPSSTHLELDRLEETGECGVYECWDTHGRKWRFCDCEDGAELELLEG